MAKKATKLRELKQLSEELNLDLPALPDKLDSKALRKQSERLIKFAQENSLVITPVGYTYFVESFVQFNACPCDRTRKSCPCNKALEEIKIKGRCLCHLFWRDYQTYLEFINHKEK